MDQINELQTCNQLYYEAIVCDIALYKDEKISLFELLKKLEIAGGALHNILSAHKEDFFNNIALLHSAHVATVQSSDEVNEVLGEIRSYAWSEVLVYRQRCCQLASINMLAYKNGELTIRTLVDNLHHVLMLFRNVDESWQLEIVQQWAVLDSICGGDCNMRYNELRKDEKQFLDEACESIVVLIERLAIDRPIRCQL